MTVPAEPDKLVPLRRAEIEWGYRNDNVVLLIQRNKALDKFMHLIYRTPCTITLELDSLGGRVWELCNGANNLGMIAAKLAEDFGERAEPVLPRLWLFLCQLRAKGLIEIYRKKQD